VWGAIGWAGTRSRCFYSGYHDPELLEVKFSLVLFMYTFYAKSMLYLVTLLII